MYRCTREEERRRQRERERKREYVCVGVYVCITHSYIQIYKHTCKPVLMSTQQGLTKGRSSQ